MTRSAPYEQSSQILTAAGNGQVIPGHEDIGWYLVDLGKPVALAMGAGMRSNAVAAASSATSRRSGFATNVIRRIPAMVGAVLAMPVPAADDRLTKP